MFLAALACGIYGNENLPSQPLLHPKNKRGINDHSMTFLSESSYSTPVHSTSPSSGYELGGSSGGFSLGHAGALLNSGGSVGHGLGYPLASSGGLGLRYQSPGLSSLSHQGVSLGGHSAQSTYSVPNIAHLGSGASSNALFVPSKTGPVTFGIHGGGAGGAASTSGSYRAPVYASGGHGLSAYGNGGSSSSLGLQLVLGSQHGPSSGASSSYSFPIHSASSSPSHSVTGGLVFSSHDGSPSSYSLPASASSHGISTVDSSSGTHGASSTYSLPISSGSHGSSALSSGDGSPGYAAPSGSYGSSSTHSGFSGASSGGSSYELPVASGSYSGPSNAVTYTNYLPSHLSGSSASYSSPSVSYATPSISHAGSAGSSYSGAGVSYSLNSNNVGSSSSPVVAYGSHSYTPMYYSSSGHHGAPADSHGAYASVSPRYFGHPGMKFYYTDPGSAKYDTISYSVPNGKY